MVTKGILILGWCTLALSACGPKPPSPVDVTKLTWDEITQRARDQTVTLVMWQGDPLINKYMREFVVPGVEKEYGVHLNIVGGQGNDLVSKLMTEREAGKSESAYDLMWINGETFYQLRQIDGLVGPFTDKLPNAQYVDFQNPFIRYDFQQEVNGYECPWGNVQLAIVYDTARVQNPPRTKEELAPWVEAHPGRFTFDASFTGLTFLKSLLYAFAGGPAELQGRFDQAKYEKYSAQLWDYLNGIKPNFWKNGKTFPEGVAQMHQLFASGEIDFTMSNNDGEVDNKILQGIFPETARGYVLDTGTIQNTHYMGIAKRSGHAAAAMAVCNFLISPEAQFQKARPAVWGDGTVLALEKLPGAWQEKFRHIPQRTHVPPRSELQPKALPEPASQYMIRLNEDFRKQVIER